MILLVDAKALYWALNGDEDLDAGARSALADPANEVLVSAATVWELEIKLASGRLTIPGDLLEAIESVGFGVVPMLGVDARAAARLPLHHRDPFDRMLAAQAGRLGALVVSRDVAFDAYGTHRLPA